MLLGIFASGCVTSLTMHKHRRWRKEAVVQAKLNGFGPQALKLSLSLRGNNDKEQHTLQKWRPRVP